LKISFDWVCVSFACDAFESTITVPHASVHRIKTTGEFSRNFSTRYSPAGSVSLPATNAKGMLTNMDSSACAT
jgi:hypothetical protein